MNIKQLELYFKQNNVPDKYYVIDGLGGGEVDGIGIIDGRWASYYSERGEKRDIQFFDTEDEACKALIKEVSGIIQEETGTPLPAWMPDSKN